MSFGQRRGASQIEVVVALGLLAALVWLVAPSFVAWRGRQQLRGAVIGLALTVERLRAAALASGRSHGLAWDTSADDLRWSEAVDGDDDGLRRDDLDAGVDPSIGGTRSLQVEFPDLRPGLPPGAPPLPGSSPPTSAIAFGTGDLLSCSPEGRASSGTVYLRTRDGVAAAMRVYGPTGRVSLWWWAGRWERLR